MESSRKASILDALTLTAVGLLCYGLLLPTLGHYWDDWVVLWLASGRSPGTLAGDYGYRPGTVWLFDLNYHLVGLSPLASQCCALAVRLLGAVALWRVVRVAWPDRNPEAFLIAVLFLVYPGFTHQSISVTYMNYHVPILLALVSTYCAARTVIESNRFTSTAFLAGALASQLLYLLIFESMIGFEIFRFAILVIILRRTAASTQAFRVWKYIKAELPYVILSVAFVLWRLTFVKSSRPDTDASYILRQYARHSPILHMGRIFAAFVNDVIDCGFYAWFISAWKGQDSSTEPVYLVGLIVGLFAAGVFHLRVRGRSASARSTDWSRCAILLGVVTIMANILVPILARRGVNLLDRYNRYSYPAGVGAAFLVVGLCDWLPRRAASWSVAGLVGLSAASQFYNAAYFQQQWRLQQSIFWQLNWRAPDLVPGSAVILLASVDRDLSSDYALYAPLNFIYTTRGESPLYAHLFDDSSLTMMQRGGGPIARYGGLRGDFDKFLVVYQGASDPRRGGESTLRILDPERADELPESAGLPREISRYSQPQLIRPDGPTGLLPERLFGSEPRHGWTWYFQKAELARELKNFVRVAELGREAESRGLSPTDLSERFVFIEGFLKTGDEPAASGVAKQMILSEGYPMRGSLLRWLARLANAQDSSVRPAAMRLEEVVLSAPMSSSPD